MTIQEIFAFKRTENGDKTFSTTTNTLLDILFMTEYYSKNLDKLPCIGTSEKDKLFSMFIRDPRFGIGKRDIGRRLMLMSGIAPEDVIKAGRFDDLFIGWEHMSKTEFKNMCDYIYNEIINGNELCKKWMPRYSSKNLMLARKIAKTMGFNKQQYGHFIKCDTTENKLSRKNTEEIEFSHVPSLAMIKYFNRFNTGADTKERFVKYLADVKAGKKKLNVSTSTVYDIYKNRAKIDADLFFDKIEKVSGNWIPVVDTSGSMYDDNDSFGKACAVGHYLAKCSSYAPDTVLSFSSHPQILKLGEQNKFKRYSSLFSSYTEKTQELNGESKYIREIESMYTGDCSNTNFGAMCEKLKELDPNDYPEWIIVLSDMEFDSGSSQSKDEMMNIFKKNGMNTKLIWWNFNSRDTTCPETDKYGNIFMSGYNPMLLKYLQVGFDGNQFLEKLLEEYKENINK